MKHPNRRRGLVLLLGLITLAVASKTTLYLLTDLEPKPPRKMEPEYSVEGGVYRFENADMKVEVEYMDKADRAAYYKGKDLSDPFQGLVMYDNLVTFRLRIENLDDAEDLNMSPGAAQMGNALVLDETTLYQMFYRMKDGEERLAAVGRTLFIKPLQLPPGLWIERLLLFQYDDPYPVRRMDLILSSILVGQNGTDVVLRYKAHFEKEKI